MSWPEFFDRHFVALWALGFVTALLVSSVALRALGPKGPTS